MRNIRHAFIICGATVAAALSLPASAATVTAATTATATIPLNVRSGPGPQYSVIGAIPVRGRATITGCIQGSLWCQVVFAGKRGWAYSEYLATTLSGRSLIVGRNLANIPAVTYAAPVETVGSAVAAAPVMTGSLVEPAPAAAPLSLAPPVAVNSYVENHPLEPVYLNGEVVEGAGLPEDVALTPIPGYTYQYAYVNRVPVLVQPSTRTIAYVYR